jgi:hypothetical protein
LQVEGVKIAQALEGKTVECHEIIRKATPRKRCRPIQRRMGMTT